ncbi:disease resistance protein [Carex littledalei]|uniref:Disease resistance protein n=1 Tax=Carex littledalei TaxID=544730 RepID=A0A833R8L4_9POAL|nr:disease resistance protein [Carex littledalei]
MQCFLKDAESKKRRDERIKGWVRDVRSVAYETEDAIDTFLVKANRQKLGFIQNRLLARHTLGKKISEIQAKLRVISEEGLAKQLSSPAPLPATTLSQGLGASPLQRFLSSELALLSLAKNTPSPCGDPLSLSREIHRAPCSPLSLAKITPSPCGDLIPDASPATLSSDVSLG